MFRKNTANQWVDAQMNDRTTGAPLTADVTFNIDTASYASGSGTLTHRGGGLWRYTFTQVETNVDEIGYQFAHASGVYIGGTIITTAADPTDGASFGLSRLDTTIGSRSTLTAQQVWEYATRTLSAFGFSVTVGTNNDKTGYSLSVTPPTAQNIWEYATRTLTAFGFTVAATVADKTGYSLVVTPPTSAEIADKVLGRNIAGGSDTGRTVKDALRVLRNKVVIDTATGIITVYAEDDTTPAWTGVVTTTVGADPITAVDPA